MIIAARTNLSIKSLNTRLRTIAILVGILSIAACTTPTAAPTSEIPANGKSTSPAENTSDTQESSNSQLSSNAYKDNTVKGTPLFDNSDPYKKSTPDLSGNILSNPNQSPLESVELLVKNQSYQEAKSLAQRIDRSRLTLQQRARLDLAEAQIFSANNQNTEALQKLNTIKPSLLSSADSGRLFWLKARTKHQLGDPQGALEALANRQNYIATQELPTNQQMMESLLSALTPEQRQSIPQNTQNPNLLYWFGSNNIGSLPNSQTGPLPPLIATPSSTTNIPSTWQQNSPTQVAVLLPYSSNFSGAAKEFEAGFNQAHTHNTSSYKPQLRFYDVGLGDIQTKINIAIQNGATFIIGPLGKNAATTALNTHSQVPILAIGGASNSQPNKFTFSLSPEAEGASIAQHARSKGLKNAVIFTPNTIRSARLSNAFQSVWQSLGGSIQTYEFTPGEFDQSTSVKLALGIYSSEQRYTSLSNIIGSKPKFNASRKSDIDMILIASNYEDAKNLKPQLNFFDAHSVPTYGSSSLNRLAAPIREKADLDGLIIPEMNYLVTNSANTQQADQQSTLSRLQALGYDSYQLIPIINKLKNQQLSYKGKTGTLLIDNSGNTIRTPNWAKFSSGNLISIP